MENDDIFTDDIDHFIDNIDELLRSLKTMKYNIEILGNIKTELDVLNYIKKDLQQNINAINDLIDYKGK